MKTLRALVQTVVVALAVCAVSEGRAQESAAAEALFNSGVKDLLAGNYPAGCPALAASLRLDPRPGTLFTLADCEAKLGKAASALSHFAVYLRVVAVMKADEQSRHADRRQLAEQRMRELDAIVPYLTLVLRDAPPQGTLIRRDRLLLGRASLGVAIPVDAGKHTVETLAPGGLAHVITVEVAPGERKTVELEVMLPVPGASHPAIAADRPAERKYSGLALAAGGIGAAGLIVGTVTGVMALGKKGAVTDNCAGTLCNTQGIDAADRGRSLSDVATVSYGVGFVGLGAGAILWLIGAPGKNPTTQGWRPVVSSDGSQWASAAIQGTW